MHSYMQSQLDWNHPVGDYFAILQSHKTFISFRKMKRDDFKFSQTSFYNRLGLISIEKFKTFLMKRRGHKVFSSTNVNINSGILSSEINEPSGVDGRRQSRV